MRSDSESWRGRAALMVGHCAGMVDLVALPVWVGALIAQYGFSPTQAGALATLFLMGAVASSVVFAPKFNRVDAKALATAGFAVAAAAFAATSFLRDFAGMAFCHILAGAAIGCALSFTHGTVAHSRGPHRLFAMLGFALGVFAVVFLGATPGVVASFGGPALFRIFAGVMAVATLVSALAFPRASERLDEDIVGEIARLKPAVWFGIAGVACMTLTQAMMFSFVERIGLDRGFGREAVTGVLIALGFVNLFPAPLAALTETRLPAQAVLIAGPLAQAAVAAAIAFGSGFPAYALPTAIFAAVLIFTHTFAFGALARLDPTSRALAGTPAMVMTGAAVGPILGGALVQAFGYPALGVAAIAIGLVASILFSRVRLDSAPLPHAAPLRSSP